MKVIIAGSRTINPYLTYIAHEVCESKFNVTEVVCGLAKGVDLAGREWAYLEGIRVKEFPANWNQYGSKAGILRNIEMGKYADALLAIWDGKSRGTAHMIDYMKQLNKPVHVKIVNATSG